MAARVAQLLWLRLGPEGIAAALAFVEGCESFGDEAAARFWTGIAREVETLAARSNGGSAGDAAKEPLGQATTRGTWRLMQKIERYRHRAVQAARAASARTHRTQMVEIAAHWFELAREAETLAMEIDARASCDD